jgi:glycosidase
MQWDAGANAGFTTGKPWLKVNPNYTEINVAAQENDPNSILNYYRALIALRKREEVIREGDYRPLLAERDDVYAYERCMEGRKLTMIANFSGNEIDFPAEIMAQAGAVELCNYPTHPQGGKLRPYEAAIYLK